MSGKDSQSRARGPITSGCPAPGRQLGEAVAMPSFALRNASVPPSLPGEPADLFPFRGRSGPERPDGTAERTLAHPAIGKSGGHGREGVRVRLPPWDLRATADRRPAGSRPRRGRTGGPRDRRRGIPAAIRSPRAGAGTRPRRGRAPDTPACLWGTCPSQSVQVGEVGEVGEPEREIDILALVP